MNASTSLLMSASAWTLGIFSRAFSFRSFARLDVAAGKPGF